jgi:hypothetical protein
VVCLLALAGCSGSDGPVAETSATDTATTTGSDGPVNPDLVKADANTATIAVLAGTFEANGVENPDRWAREVDEYRPYPTDDPDLGKLRDELAKYDPSPETLELIIASLKL